MSATLPPSETEAYIDADVWPPLHQGKVRDTYDLGGGLLLVVTTDRVSAFDFVLPGQIPYKGEVLNALNIWWKTQAGLINRTRSDMVAYGRNIEKYLPSVLQGKDNTELYKRAVVVQKLEMLDAEMIVRGYLTGSGLKSYQETGEVCGHKLPLGLHDGSTLPVPIFTPSTKAKVGHDEHITAEFVCSEYGDEPENMALKLYTLAYNIIINKGIILADTKLEFGYNQHMVLCVADEAFTPDSSRYWNRDDWKKAEEEGRSPQSRDKEFVRQWAKTHNVHNLDPKNPEHIRQVHTLIMPEDVICETTRIYKDIAGDILDVSLEKWQEMFLF